MEGLHHDTILEPSAKDSAKIKKESNEEEKGETHSDQGDSMDFSTSTANQSLSAEDKVDLYEKMVRI